MRKVDGASTSKRKEGEPAHEHDRWFSFTAPTTMIKQMTDVVSQARRDRDLENGELSEKPMSSSPTRSNGDHDPSGAGKEGRLDVPSRSGSGADTPGWLAPWTPFRRQRSDPFDRFMAGPSEGPPTGDHARTGPSTRLSRFQDFLLYSAFAPLYLRLVNLAFTASLLGVAARIIVLEKQADLVGILGISTVFTLVVTPLTIVHVFISLYLEYFGSPIGIWTITTKMSHILVDLFFVGLWAALLSISFDDYFTTSCVATPARTWADFASAVCVAFTPYARFRGVVGNSSIDGSATDELCDMQGALIALTFIGLVLYQAVLIVNLLRVFKKVTRKN